MIIRNETSADIEEISKVTIAAFRDLAISNHTEQFIINALREADALTISLVAEIDGEVVGHIAFSPVTISDGAAGWYGLGPVSILPEYQKKESGNHLSVKGCLYLKSRAARVVFLWVIRTTISGWVSGTSRNWFTKEFLQKFSLPCRLPKRSQMASLCFMKGSRQRAKGRPAFLSFQ